MLAVAAYRSITPATHECLIRDLLPLANATRLDYRRFGNDALISRSRSMVASVFYEQTVSDVLLWVDADIEWRGPSDGYEGDLLRLARSAMQTRGIVGGVVPKRGFGLGIACRIGGDDFATDTDMLRESTYVGAAFMAIHRDALAAIAPTLPRCVGENGSTWLPFCATMLTPSTIRDDGVQDYLSEDWALCRRALDVGVPIHVDAKPVLGHIGEHTYTIPDSFAPIEDLHRLARIGAAASIAQDQAA